MNIRITKLYQNGPNRTLEIAFNRDPRGEEMMAAISIATGITFERPAGNRFALRELHLAAIPDKDKLDEAYIIAGTVAEQYGPVHDSQKDMAGPDDRSYARGGK